MLRSKKVFNGGINQDDSLHLIQDAQYLRIMNGRVGVTEYGKNFRVENVPGTTAISQSVYPPYGTNMTIGSCIDIEGQRMIWFVWNSMADHGIYCYDFRANQVYAVLYDSQVAGGLNFSKSYRIDKNCRVDQGLLYWTDNYNEPKKINIDSGIKLNYPAYSTTAVAYTSLTDSYEINLIRRPPIFAPAIAKQTDAAFVNNFIGTVSYQFAWQYVYFDGEESVLSEFSVASKLNGNVEEVVETFNYIKCDLSTNEIIPQTARFLRLIAKNQFSETASVIKSWDKLVEPNVFINHNAGTTPLTYSYYGNTIGETIDSAVLVKPYDSVPLLTKTLETATNRLFLGNNLSGYNTPTVTSLGYTTTITTATASITTNVLEVQLVADDDPMYDPFYLYAYYVYLDTVPNPGFYYLPGTKREQSITPPTMGTVPTTGDFQTLRYDGYTINEVATTSAWIARSPLGYYNTYGWIDLTDTYIVTGLDTTANLLFKNESSYQLGVVFYDKARRKCGVVTNSNLIVSTPLKTFANNSGVSTINWTLNNNSSTTEIPNWAYYYSIVRTLNLKTRYFIDSTSHTNVYVTKNGATGVNEFTQLTYNSTVRGIAIDTDALLQSKMGYNYTAGDICVLTSSTAIGGNTRWELPVTGQDGKWVLLSSYDLGDLTSVDLNFEIYTPYLKNDIEPFYEVGNMYKITNPTASNRIYSTLSGNFNGDIYNFSISYDSGSYNVEAMAPNTAYYQYWFNDNGFPNFVTLLGQKRSEHEIRYSNVYTPGTQNNGLSTFEALNFKTVPLGTGSIQKLQLASKTTEQGVIMLAVCSLQTASCYLGEVQVVGASQNAFLAQDASVIGTINVLKGMFGTTAPETVVEYLGVIFWYDLNNGTIVQYSSNGLFPISSFKMERLFKNYAKGYLAASTATLDTLNGFHHIPTFIDPFHKEFGASLPGLIADASAAVLPSYASTPSYATSIINRFDISDGLAKSLTFNIQENKWVSDYQFLAEQYEYFENRMFGFKNGALYEFNKNSSTWNTWFGTAYPVRVCWVLNQPLSGLKDMAEITLESIQAPNYTVVYTTLPNTQITDLTSSDYVNQEGIFYGKLFRDRLSPNATGTADEKMMNGDVVLSQIPQIMTEFQCYSSLFYINFVDVGFNLSRGQNFILNNK
jgi:hypothetical protein